MLIYVTLSGLTFLLLTTQLFTGPETTFPVLLALKSTHKLVLAPMSIFYINENVANVLIFEITKIPISWAWSGSQQYFNSAWGVTGLRHR